MLLLQLRSDPDAARAERRAYRAATGLGSTTLRPHDLAHHRLREAGAGGSAGVLVGAGGGYEAGIPEREKTLEQRRIEDELRALADWALAGGAPVLFSCFSAGVLTQHLGGALERRDDAEELVDIDLTDGGRDDVLFGTLPARFAARAGHAEHVARAPLDALPLARSAGRPVQAYRVGGDVYAARFHPETVRPGGAGAPEPAGGVALLRAFARRALELP